MCARPEYLVGPLGRSAARPTVSSPAADPPGVGGIRGLSAFLRRRLPSRSSKGLSMLAWAVATRATPPRCPAARPIPATRQTKVYAAGPVPLTVQAEYTAWVSVRVDGVYAGSLIAAGDGIFGPRGRPHVGGDERPNTRASPGLGNDGTRRTLRAHHRPERTSVERRAGPRCPAASR